MNRFTLFFNHLFRRKPKPAKVQIRALKAGGDIIGRQGGQKRNRVHIYRQPLGYPIRLCDWIAVDMDTIERIGEAQGITGGPAELPALNAGLDWSENWKKAVICKHCRALVNGKRGPVMGAPGGDFHFPRFRARANADLIESMTKGNYQGPACATNDKGPGLVGRIGT